MLLEIRERAGRISAEIEERGLEQRKAVEALK